MAKHIVKVVEDGALATGEGWAMIRAADGDFYFLVERSAAVDPQVLTDAWDAARRLEEENDAMREAVARGHAS